MSDTSVPISKPILFVRSPDLSQMRDPLQSAWNPNQENHGNLDQSNKQINLAELIDFGQMNETFANYLEVVGLPVSIIDLKGKVLASSKWQRICMEFHRVNEGTLSRCIESDIYLSEQMEEGKGYAIYRCHNGLTDCAAPIYIEGQHIANLFIGQFFLNVPSYENFEQQQRNFGFEREAYFQALSEVPIVEEAKLPAIMRLMVGLANQVAQQSLSAYRLRIANDTLSERNQTLHAAKEAAEAANIAKTAFLANMSHEMRTPLHQISGLAQLIRRETLSSKQNSRMEMLETSCRNLTKIIETILDLTKIDSGKFDIPIETFSVQGLLDEICFAVEDRAREKNLNLQAEFFDGPEDFMGGKKHIQQALLNYVDNAIRFTDVGNIVIRSELISDDGKWVCLRFAVQDTGIGFTPESKARLFNLFEQVDNSSTRKYGGLGAGLAMTKKIANLMEGTVGCEGRLGGGSTFWFTAKVMKV
jgi:signal transduction histidine kinase